MPGSHSTFGGIVSGPLSRTRERVGVRVVTRPRRSSFESQGSRVTRGTLNAGLAGSYAAIGAL